MTQNENRNSPRRRALLKARLVYQNGAFSVAATIRNLSETGAKLAVTQSQYLPSELFMIDVREAVAYRARVAWRSASEIGLSFISKHPLDDTLDQNLRFLRVIWGGNAP